MTELDEVFLEHVGRYHLSLGRIAAQKEFFGPEQSKAAIARLKKQGRLQVTGVGRSPQGFSYYQLTVAEARRLHVPEHRAKRMNGEALHKNLATLWFCLGVPPYRRSRLESSEYPQGVGPPPNTREPICLEEAPTGVRLARLLVPGSTAGLQHTLRTIQDEALNLLRHPASANLLDGQQLRFVVLVELESRRQRVLEAIQGLRVGPLREIAIDAELAPGPTTVRDFLRS
jgi:hypothetical protein